MIFDGPPHESNAPYAYAKRMAIVQLEAYRKQYGLKSTTIIPCNIYGPNDNYDLETSHVIPALIRKCFEAKMNDTPLVVWGSGEPMREFVYSEDIAHFAERVLFEYGSTPPLIVSPLVQFKVSEVVTQIASIMEFEGDVVYDTSKPDGQMRKPSDSRTTLSTFCNDEFQLHGLKDGLEKTIEAYVASLTGA
jgi:GDP-L-fucose synthase